MADVGTPNMPRPPAPGMPRASRGTRPPRLDRGAAAPMATGSAGRVPSVTETGRGLAVPEDVERHRLAGRVLAHDEVERVGRVERRAVDRRDDVAGLRGRPASAGLAGDDRRPACVGRRRPWPNGSWLNGIERSAGRVRVLGVRVLAGGALAGQRRGAGIQAPLSTGRLASFLIGRVDRLEPDARATGGPAAGRPRPGRAAGGRC